MLRSDDFGASFYVFRPAGTSRARARQIVAVPLELPKGPASSVESFAGTDQQAASQQIVVMGHSSENAFHTNIGSIRGMIAFVGADEDPKLQHHAAAAMRSA